MKKLLFLLCVFTTSFARIEPLATMKQLLSSVTYDKDTCFIFDIDNTVAESDLLGSDQWFFYEVTKQPFDQLLEIYFLIQNSIDLYPVEKEVVGIIRRLQKEGYMVMALTARSTCLMDRTIEQLKRIKVNFSHTAPSKKQFPLSLTHPAYYKDGILFCSSNAKGDLLVQFFDMTGHRPAQVIFIDDKQYNVDSVDKGLSKNNIPCVCLRYSYLDEKVKNLDKQEADRLLQEYKDKHRLNKMQLPEGIGI